MAVTLAQLRKNVKTVAVTYNGLTINLTYRPAAITPGFSDDDDDKAWLVNTLLKLLIGWDVYEDDAQSVMTPITADVLSGDGIGLPLLKAMFRAILDDALTGKTNGATSDAG